MTRNLSVQAKVSTLALAVALAAGPSPALAQSFQGTHSATGATVDHPEAGVTNITVNQQQAVINWTATNNPVDGTIVFQPDGTVATFSGATDFAVLNRITPGTAGNAIYMGGTIQSLVGDVTGGTVFFYSPNGIVIGANAVINVGSLGLTTLPISDDGQGNWMTGFGTSDPQVTFGQATDPNSFIRTDAAIDGSIRSNGSGSYVALVAPSIHHQGRILTDGTAALVAAEAATITFNPFGLFDITVTTGTDAETGIHVDGGTIGRNSETVSSDNIHRAYLVAVAKNDAVTMLINNGAEVGFEIGTSATVEDNAVVISGGYDVDNGDQQFFGTSGTSNVALTITNATLSSNVDAKVTGGAAINSGDGALTFGGDLSIFGGETTTTGGNVLIDGQNGNDLTIAGDLYARAARINGDGSETGLITRLGASGGSTVTVGGNVTLDSDSFGTTVGEFGETGTNATGGNAQVNIGANSALDVTGSINVHADGYGGASFGGTAGNGIGGQALVMAIEGGATITAGSVAASASGSGGSYIECSVCGTTGGNGVGGNASVHTNVGTGNSMDISGDVTITAAGQGGAGDAQAGGGFGGTASLFAGDNSSLQVGADTEVDASGLGGDGEENQGGLGRGGTARIGTNTGGSIDLTGPVFVTANGEGGSSSAVGGTGTGGIAQISAFLGTIHAFNNVSVSAHSSGGFAFGSGTGGAGLADVETTITPDMTEASLFAGGGTLIVEGLTVVSAGATGGNGGFDGGDGGDAVAAGVAGTVNGGAVIHAGNSDAGPSVIQLGGVTVSAEASGGAGGDGQGGVDGSDGGNGGSATGGKAIMTAAAGSGDLTAGATIISASAVGGDGGSGGGADGGSGGNGGNGGDATGGFINVGSESGDVNFAQASNDGIATYTSILAFTNATGGNGGDAGFGSPAGIAGDGGDAIGGDIALLVRGSTVNVGNVNLVANANGGNGGLDLNEALQGIGGDAVTGSVNVLVTNRFEIESQRGTLNAGTITGNAFATGGEGSTSGAQWTLGGSGFEIVNSDATINNVSILVSADGIDPDAVDTFSTPIAIVNGSALLSGGFNFQTPGHVSVLADGGTLTAASVSISADTFIHDPFRTILASVGTISADTIGLGTGGDLIVDAHLVSTGSLSLSAPGLVDIEDATSGGDINGSAGTSFTAGSLTAAGTVSVTAQDAISLEPVNAGTDITVISFLDTITAGGMSSADGSISLSAEGDVSTGDLTASGDIDASSGGAISILSADSNGGSVFITADGPITAGNLSAFGSIELDATGNIIFADVNADQLDFESGGSVTGSDIIAGTFVTGEAQGAVSLGNINVGILQEGGATEDGFAVGLVSATSIEVQDVEADEGIGFATLGTLTTGDLDAGTNVMALASGDMSLGSITTAPDGRTYLADAQMYLDNGGDEDNFDPNAVLALAPVATDGSITINGPVTTGVFQAAAGTNFTASAITAPFFSDEHLVGGINVSAGGTASINGTWTGAGIQVTSNDIDITETGLIDGSVSLVSTNATQTVIGDGIGGGGYQLSDAEFDRIIGAGVISVATDAGLGANPQMIIGDLSIDATNPGNEFGTEYQFATYDVDDEAGAVGSIRVVGEMVFTNAENDDVFLTTETFELDAETGLLALTGSGTDPAGSLQIEASHIHVASGEILDQLAENPQYEGYQDDLNAPAAVPRPDGVIRAGNIEIDFEGAESATLYVQNTGTADTPAGFLVTEQVFLGEDEELEMPPGSIDLIINGQIIQDGETLTGIDVRDAMVADQGDLTAFTENSTINGCLLAGACTDPGPPDPPLPPDFTPTPGIQDEVTLIDDDILPPPEFGNEDVIDDNDEETEDDSPIQPPNPLFDTSDLSEEGGTVAPEIGTPMRSTPGLTDTGDVDDPVSGTGNPALMETTPQTKEEQQQ